MFIKCFPEDNTSSLPKDNIKSESEMGNSNAESWSAVGKDESWSTNKRNEEKLIQRTPLKTCLDSMIVRHLEPLSILPENSLIMIGPKTKATKNCIMTLYLMIHILDLHSK
jgi:hypothetical protein